MWTCVKDQLWVGVGPHQTCSRQCVFVILCASWDTPVPISQAPLPKLREKRWGYGFAQQHLAFHLGLGI